MSASDSQIIGRDKELGSLRQFVMRANDR